MLHTKRPALRLTLVASALVAIATPSFADPEPCVGKDLLADITGPTRDRVSALLARVDKEENSRAVFWRIEKTGLPASHVLGTLHIAHPSLASLSTAVKAEVEQARVVALEQKELSRGAYANAMAQAGKLMSARDKPLQRMLDHDQLRVVEKAIFDAGYPEDLALGIRPWVATLFLAGSCASASGEPMDLIVSAMAKSLGKPMVGLETLVEQFESLAAIPDDAQAAWLRASIELHDRLDDVAVTMVELYRQRRVGASLDLTRELAPNAGLSDAQMQDLRHGLIIQRNERLAERSVALIEEGGAFIAIGAAHLPGPDGVISLLKKRGYAAVPVE